MIKPAMTPEEWARNFTPSRWIDGEEPCHADCHIKEESRHGMAAICLHEQPFGFTQEMVEELVELEAGSHHPATAPHFGDVSFLLDIADVIEALLPPEEK